MFICATDNSIIIDVSNRVIGIVSGNAMWKIAVQERVRDSACDILCLNDYATRKRATEVMEEIKLALIEGRTVYVMPEK